MKIIRKSSQFKKDFKRFKNNPEKLEKLRKVLMMLVNGEKLPKELKEHKLSGRYKDCMECHVEGDFLLIWIDEIENVIELIRLGSHSELFG